MCIPNCDETILCIPNYDETILCIPNCDETRDHYATTHIEVEEIIGEKQEISSKCFF